VGLWSGFQLFLFVGAGVRGLCLLALIYLKSSGLVKYSIPKINNIEMMKDSFCIINNNPQISEQYKNKE
jgi:hypothetical protein